MRLHETDGGESRNGAPLGLIPQNGSSVARSFRFCSGLAPKWDTLSESLRLCQAR
jgi:hypothetical protein